jgi:hypothetical protein
MILFFAVKLIFAWCFGEEAEQVRKVRKDEPV